jgi:glycosyltransferase involved in cell wall biosynthesis
MKQRTGTEVYNAEIIKHLLAIDHHNHYRLYTSRPPVKDMQDLGSNVAYRVMPFTRGWTLFRLTWEIALHQPDLLFIPAHILPLYPGRRSVVMIHDIGYDHFPDLYKWTDIAYHRYAIRFAKQFATHILTPSEFTRQDLHKKYGVPLAKITTVHHGFDSAEYRPAEKGETSPEKEPYFYYIGRLEYKKNISRMLQAFAAFKTESGLPHKFILAGRQAHGYAEIQKTYDGLPSEIKKNIVFLGYTEQAKATRYLRHAEALVFTTLFEGFGFPVLEAFASGTPVITSNTTCLPEIAGEAALLVDPLSIESIAAAMIKLANNKGERQRLRAAGDKQYRQFSWEKAAQKTLDVFEKVGRHA